MTDVIGRNDILEAVKNARLTMKAADTAANDMAVILKDRLHHVNSWNLKDLKRELARYNMHTETWT